MTPARRISEATLRTIAALALLGGAPGCATWIDQEPGCRFNVYDWSDDLLAHIMAGPGDGSFDYDPEDTPRQGLTGSYDIDTGDYAWSIDYASSYFIRVATVSGYGTAYHTGNLDILQTTTATDVLGQDMTWNERTLREGCSMTTQSWSADDQSDLIEQTGTYVADNAYEWSADISGYTYEGSWHQNLSRTETITADDGSYYSQITTKPEGTAEGDIAFTDSGYDYEGTTLRRFDGGEEDALAVSQNGQKVADIRTNYAYDGSGTATYAYTDGSTCNLTVDTSGSCSYTCSDGSSGSC